ncbi:hypothetical protein RHGRI_035160 [Rhododendron griersonianum]|uniref:GMP synthase [glutamine-hydrolyzing] n=1 Tax=Rhododendron griersonianum TaxID=479676 RepID=A0AAV6I6N7_9ERIC|nr:hypothetical protein RHGRI_035160 [Rhododendron griersonianum]
MSGPTRMRSTNCGESEPRPVLAPAGNKARTVDTSKQLLKSLKKIDKPRDLDDCKAKKYPPSPVKSPGVAAARCLSNVSMNASSCSSDASSSDSSCSRGRMMSRRRSVTPVRRKQGGPKMGRVEKVVVVVGSDDGDSGSLDSGDSLPAKRRCAWVTPNTDPSYAAFHDEEWGVPVHDDKKLFELLILSTALAELSWPAILNKRNALREVFLDFDPIAVSKLNEKKILTPASSLISEVKQRATIENARQTSKIIVEFGSFDKYIWGFVNQNPTVNQFRYPRQVPIKTSKADAISKDLVRRGFRGVGPTVVYSFMQVVGMTNDHLVSCFRFQECIDAADASSKDGTLEGTVKEDKQPDSSIELGLGRGIDNLSLSSTE